MPFSDPAAPPSDCALCARLLSFRHDNGERHPSFHNAHCMLASLPTHADFLPDVNETVVSFKFTVARPLDEVCKIIDPQNWSQCSSSYFRNS